MAREFYGCEAANVITQISSDGDFEPGTAVFDVYTARTGGSPVTDLLNISSGAITAVTPDANGRVIWQGVDGYQGTYWLSQQSVGTTPRYAVNPSRLADLVAAIVIGGSGVTSWAGQTGAINTPVIADISDATAVGEALVTAASQAAGRTALGGTTIGGTIFTAADVAAVLAALGVTSLGTDLITSPTATDARQDLGMTTLGEALATAASAVAGRTLLSTPSQAETDLKVKVPPGMTAGFQFGKGPIANRPAPGTVGLEDGAIWLETAP